MIENYADVIDRAKKSGISYMQTICTQLSQVEELQHITQNFEGIFSSVGVHPCNVTQASDIPSPEDLLQLSQSDKTISFGETGLDYYHPDYNKKAQISSFLNHIEAASKNGLPVVVHTRSAAMDTKNILHLEYKNKPFKGLIHCFTLDVEFASKVLDIDFYISIAGIITFKNPGDLIEVVKYVPLDKLLIETDTPYLAPIPMRGKQNEPAFVRFVAQKIADIKNITLDEVAEATTNNFFKLFDKARRL